MAKEKEVPSAQQALLGLERSTALPEEQLDHALSILDVRLDDLRNQVLQNSGGKVANEGGQIFAPKEEWILRWLLKRIRSTFAKGPKYSLLENTWFLLNHVISQIPSKSLGRLLKEADFLNVMDSAISEVYEEFGIRESYFRYVEKTRQLSRNRIDPDSDSAISTGTLKRKRSSTDNSVPSSKRPEHSQVSRSEVTAITRSFLAVLSKCAILATRGSELSIGSSQHLRLALRGTPELVASLLGRVLVAAELLMEAADTSPLTDPSDDLGKLRDVLELWSFRAEQGSGNLISSSDSAFVQQLLLPCLTIIDNSRRTGFSGGASLTVRTQMERLVSLHVAQPLKLSLQQLFDNNKDSVQTKTQTSVDTAFDFLQPAGRVLGVEKGESNGSVLLSRHVSLLLEICARSVLRNNIRRKQQENSWLQSVFLALARLAGCPILNSQIPSSESMGNVSDLQRLLATSKKYDIQMDENVLANIAMTYAGLQEKQHCDWTLLSEIVAHDPMIFVTSTADDSLFTKLLSRLSAVQHEDEPAGNGSMKTVIDSILQPILAAFARSRQLPSFIEAWRRQLTSYFEANAGDSSIWSDDDFMGAFINVARGNLTVSSIDSLLSTAIQTYEDSDVSTTTCCAQVTIADAILSSSASECAAFSSKLTVLSRTVSDASMRKEVESRFLWRAYRFLHHSHTALVNVNQADSVLELPKALRKQALKSIVEILSSKKSFDSSSAVAAYEAFQLLVVYGIIAERSSKKQKRDPIEALASVLRDASKTSGTQSLWNGRVFTMSTPLDLAYACIAVILVNPTVLTNREDHAEILLTALVQAIKRGIPAPYNEAFSNILLVFAGDDRFAKQPGWSARLFKLLSEALEKQVHPSTAIIKALLTLPMEPVSRKRKADVSDMILESLTQNGPRDSDELQSLLALLFRITVSADPAAKILSDEDELWRLSNVLKSDRGADVPTLKLFQEIVRLSLDRKAMSIDSESAQDYLRVLIVSCRKYMGKTKTMDCLAGPFHICQTVISESRRLQDRIKSVVSDEELKDLRTRFVTILATDLRALTKDPGLPIASVANKARLMLRSLSFCYDASEQPKELEKTLSKLEKLLKTRGEDDHQTAETRLMLQNARLQLECLASDPLSVESIAATVKHFEECIGVSIPPSQDVSRYAFVAKTVVAEMPSRSKIELLKYLQTVDFSGSSGMARLLLTFAIMTGTKLDVAEAHESHMVETLYNLLRAITKCTDEAIFALLSDTIIAILQDHPEAVNQWNFDTLLSTIAIATSPSGPQITTPTAQTLVFPRLCRILTVALLRYRKRLGGRYHLLIPALQGLITSIFTPPPPRVFPIPKDDFWLTHLPSWSTTDTAAHPHPLTPKHIHSFTRLLQTLTDPSPSTTTSHSRSTLLSLTDTTALARRLAGTYLSPPFLQLYCHLPIRGGTIPSGDARDALRPGLWSVMDAMSLEGMRTMNAQMPGAGERGVWKEVYAEWRRRGGGGGMWKGD